MFIAEQKRKENIAEYLLYMWQVEDIVRAFNFDIEAIKYNLLVEQYSDENDLQKEVAWYNSLIQKMKSEKIEKKGHLAELGEIISEMYYLHNTLLSVASNTEYIQLCDDAAEYIEEYRLKSHYIHLNEVELCLNALYTKLLLRLKKQKISSETESAFDAFRKIIAYLTKKYHQMKNGDIKFQMN